MNRLCFLSVTVVLLLVEMFSSSARPLFAQPQALPSSLKWYAEIAKQRGQTSIEIGELIQPMAPRSTKEIIEQNTLVQGYVESSEVISDDYRLFTWYKIKVEGNYVVPQPTNSDVSRLSTHTPDSKPPVAFSELNLDEILVRVEGGTAIVNGVQITQFAQPLMKLNQHYMLFLKSFSKTSYRYGHETEPIAIRSTGELLAYPPTSFSKQFQTFNSVNAVRNSVH